MQGTGRDWLSLTPEPETELPEAVATLRYGAPPPRERVTAERERFEHLIVRARRRAYHRWLAEARALAAPHAHAGADPALRPAADLTLSVIDNHEALKSGLMKRGRGGRGGRGR
jgi:hypothetical protein